MRTTARANEHSHRVAESADLPVIGIETIKANVAAKPTTNGAIGFKVLTRFNERPDMLL